MLEPPDARRSQDGPSSDDVRRQDQELRVHDQAEGHGGRHDGVDEPAGHRGWLDHGVHFRSCGRRPAASGQAYG